MQDLAQSGTRSAHTRIAIFTFSFCLLHASFIILSSHHVLRARTERYAVLLCLIRAAVPFIYVPCVLYGQFQWPHLKWRKKRFLNAFESVETFTKMTGLHTHTVTQRVYVMYKWFLIQMVRRTFYVDRIATTRWWYRTSDYLMGRCDGVSKFECSPVHPRILMPSVAFFNIPVAITVSANEWMAGVRSDWIFWQSVSHNFDVSPLHLKWK